MPVDHSLDCAVGAVQDLLRLHDRPVCNIARRGYARQQLKARPSLEATLRVKRAACNKTQNNHNGSQETH